MYKCPFCKSENCEELINHQTFIPQSNQGYFTMGYNYHDYLSEILCRDCGIVTKIDPSIYKDTSNGEETN